MPHTSATPPGEADRVKRDAAYYREVRAAVGRGTPTLLLGTSARSLDRAVQRIHVQRVRSVSDRAVIWELVSDRRRKVGLLLGILGTLLLGGAVAALAYLAAQVGRAGIEVIIFVVAAGFAFIVASTIIVVVGVHREERYHILENRQAPGAVAQMARIVLGRYVRLEQHEDKERTEHPAARSASAREKPTE